MKHDQTRQTRQTKKIMPDPMHTTSMTSRKATILCFILLFNVVAAGCASIKEPYPKIAYYTLEYEAPAPRSAAPLPATLKVERFGINPLYDSNNIVYREQQNTRDYYFYHKWRINPAAQVETFLKRDLEHEALFKGVFGGRNKRLPATYVLEGTVDDFLEWDNEENWQAVLAVTITLLSSAGTELEQQIIFQKKFTSSQPCEEKSPPALARAMSRAMAEVSKEISKEIETRLTAKTH